MDVVIDTRVFRNTYFIPLTLRNTNTYIHSYKSRFIELVVLTVSKDGPWKQVCKQIQSIPQVRTRRM